jgi:hypothetical protein
MVKICVHTTFVSDKLRAPVPAACVADAKDMVPAVKDLIQ